MRCPVTAENMGSNPISVARANSIERCSTVVSDDGGYRNFQSLFRRTRARCMGVTVNHWLVEFDSLMRSQVSFVVCKPWGKRQP